MEKKKKLSKKNVWFLSGILVVIMLISGVTLIKGNNNDEDFSSIPREYFVEKGDIIAAFTGGGQIKLSGKDYNFSKPVVLEDVFVTVGQSVKAGDILAGISKESIEKKLEELQDELIKANLSLQQAINAKELSILNQDKVWNQKVEGSKQQFETEKTGIESEIKKLDEQLAAIQTQTHHVQTQIDELKALEEGDTETANKEQLEQLNQQLEELNQQETVIRSQISDALNRLNELKGHREKELGQESHEAASNQEINNKSLTDLENSITLAQMEVERVKSQIEEINQLNEDQTLVAESDGIVTAVGYSANSETTVEKPVVTIGGFEEVTAEITVSQNDVNKLEVGQMVHIEATAFPGEKISTKVKSINYAPIQEGSSILYKVIVEIDSNHQFIEGMTVSAKFIIKEVNNVLTLSNKAIEYRNGKQIVNVKKEDESTEVVEIQTGFSDGRVSEVKSGLNEGDIVIVGG